MNFEEFKTEVLNRARQAQACRDQYRRAAAANTWEELVEVVRDNVVWVSNNHIVTNDMVAAIERTELFGSGTDNVGLFNSGDRNSGDLNTGDCNSGNRNTGDCNTGNRNTGNCNTGDCNSGYRNSGVFCNRGREDSIMMFNKDSGMTWDEWLEHPVYSIVCDFRPTEWVDWNEMGEQQRAEHPEAETTGGYLKTREYKEAWRILWDSLNDELRGLFKTLPGYDADIFEDITGIRYE